MALTSLQEQPGAAISNEQPASDTGWRRARTTRSLSEVFGTIATRPTGSLWRKLTAFLGPGFRVRHWRRARPASTSQSGPN